jgi:hypothetical protein
LKRERDTFIQQFFRRGAQLSEELLGDIERLREQVRELETENAKLRAQLASDAAIRDLIRKIEELEEEKRQLMAQTARVGVPIDEFAQRFAELEAELANLGTLHVANVQLHASTTVRRAFRNLRELLAQFLGADKFAVYWEAEGGILVPINVEGVTIKEARGIPIEDSPAGAAYLRGEIFVDPSLDTSQGSIQRPAALIPMHMSSQRLGAIVIMKTLPQKTRFDAPDHGLFKLLSTQAAPSIVHAHLFAAVGRRAPSVQAFIDQED